MENPDTFYPWQCITLVRSHSTTDFVIKDESDMMALLHVLHYLIYKPKSGTRFMLLYKMMKLQMKLSYQAWTTKKRVKDVILRAIEKTLEE